MLAARLGSQFIDWSFPARRRRVSKQRKEAVVGGEAPSWKELSAQYSCPQWFRDAKFGIWAHWGVQSVPKLGGGWVAKHMYMADVGRETWGANAYSHHCQTYGHPSEFGYKDVANLWRAEKYDAPSMLRQWREWGARYAAILANHHDAFDNWNSVHYDWNAAKVGPKRDVVGEFAQAARAVGLPWIATVHDVDWVRDFLIGAHSADREGPRKGVPYDGVLTKADGAGKWWEGLDPAQLYGPPPALRTDEWKAADNRAWLKRHLQLIRDYKPDALYFDASEIPYGAEGETLCAEFYRESLRRHGAIQAIVQVKKPHPGMMYDIERGGSNTLREEPWQTDTSLANDWFLKYDKPHWHNARTVLESLCDIVSKNGNLLLSVGLYPDGSLPEDQVREMNRIGAWLKQNGEAIYASRPWRACRDGSGVVKAARTKAVDTVNAELMEAAAKEDLGHFNERTVDSPPFEHDEVRFTTREGRLFVSVLNPAPGKLRIARLGKASALRPGAVRRAALLADHAPVSFAQEDAALQLDLPGGIPTGLPLVVALEGAL
jgi:alpha-L-fucosidase